MVTLDSHAKYNPNEILHKFNKNDTERLLNSL